MHDIIQDFEMDAEQVKEESHQCNTNEENVSDTPRKKSACKCEHHSSNHPQPSKWHIACTKCVASKQFSRKKSVLWDQNGIFDTYRTFKIDHEECFDLQVTVHRGENITKGSWIQDALDTPDPYIMLRIPEIKLNTPKRTTTEEDSTNPKWDQTFHFYLYKNPSKPYEMEISLMDENVVKDEAIDKQLFQLDSLEEGIPKNHTVTFKGNSKVFITFLKQKNKETDLRFSMSLCDEEKDYLRQRRKKVIESMKSLLGDNGLSEPNEVPTIGILGSGGGFRAMIGLSGALQALQDSGILDCTTYLSGLSGSTWCISTLYCQENKDENNDVDVEENKYRKGDDNDNEDLSGVIKSTEELNMKNSNNFSGGLNVKEFQKNLCESVSKKWEWNILKMPQYVANMLSKYWKGQSMRPVTLVDIFGHLLGDLLLGTEKKNHLKLSDLQSKISKGEAPFPLLAGLHARLGSSEEFSDWIEFSPYEIGIGKYGTFMKTEHFGSKFFAGKLLKKYNEMPLHYLQGMWGSAFTINLKKHLIGGGNSNTEDTDEFTDDKPHVNGEEDLDTDSDDSEDEVEDSSGKMTHLQMKKPSLDRTKRSVTSKTSEAEQGEYFDLQVTVHRGESITKGSKLKDALDTPDPYIVLRIPHAQIKLNTPKRTSTEENSTNPRWDQTFHFYLYKNHSKPYEMEICLMDENVLKDEQIGKESFQLDCLEEGIPKDCTFTFKGKSKVFITFLKQMRRGNLPELKKKNWFVSALETVGIDSSYLLNTRAVKPGRIYNPFRGLNLRYSFHKDRSTPERDTTDGKEGKSVKYADGCIYQPLRNESKKIAVMDSGFAFNSPYPLLLRPQRGVDIFLSFDFSQLEDSQHVDIHTFKQLVRAEAWAKERHIPFPPIEKKITEYLGTEIEECYVFESSSDTYSPVILHFPLVNNKFRQYKTPGVLRSSKEELDFGNFSCFGKNSSFSTFKFYYETKEYERLSKLMEFNTLLHKDTIIKTIKDGIHKKKQGDTLGFQAIVNILQFHKRNQKEGLFSNINF